MAVYTQTEGFTLPKDLGFETGLDPIKFKYSALEDAVQAYTSITDKAFQEEQARNDKFGAYYDAITGISTDNEQQRQKLKEIREKHGLTDDVFSQITLDPSNPKSIGIIERGFQRTTKDRGFNEILQEQQLASNYMESISKIEDPALQAEAVRDYEEYRAGRKKGTDLSLGQFQKVDINDSLAKKLSQIPLGITQDLIENGTYIQEIKARGSAAVDAVIKDSMRDAKFRNNMIANGYLIRNEEGGYDMTESGQAYIESIKGAYTAEQEKLIAVKQQQAAGGTTGPVVSPGNRFPSNTNNYGAYESIAQGLDRYGVDLNDATVQQAISQAVYGEEDPGVTRARIGIIKGKNPLQAIYDSLALTGDYESYEQLAEAVKRNDNNAVAAIKGILTQIGIPEAKQDAQIARIKAAAEQPYVAEDAAGATGGAAAGATTGVDPLDAAAAQQWGTDAVTGQGRAKALEQLQRDYADPNRQAGARPPMRGSTQGADDMVEVKTKQGDVIQMTSIGAKIAGAESGNDASIGNPLSTAEGLGQFIDSTWVGMIDKNVPGAANLSKEEKLALKKNAYINQQQIQQK